MDQAFFEEVGGIYRLCVPFENIYTSVFLIVAENKKILVDCATTREDVDRYIVPAIHALGYELSDIDTLVISHKHSDHAGGKERIIQLAPNIEIVNGIKNIAKGISTYCLAGHTVDCIGVLDEGTGTLISCDGLQGAGVDKYRCSVKDKNGYLETLERIRRDTRIKNILFSHAYEPWNCNRLSGRHEVLEGLEQCKKYI